MVDAVKYQERKKKSSYLADGECQAVWMRADGCVGVRMRGRADAWACRCVGMWMRGREDALMCGCIGEQTRMNVKKKELTK